MVKSSPIFKGLIIVMNPFVLVVYVCLSGTCVELEKQYDTLYQCLEMETNLNNEIVSIDLKSYDTIKTKCESE